MTAVLDQTADQSLRDLYKFSKLYEFPGYVKQAAPNTVLEADSDLPSTAFADVRRRQFNCATKAATWVSYLYFLEKKAELHPKIASWIEERLNSFAKSWGISHDIDKLREKHAELNRPEHYPDSSYLYVWASDGKKDRRYPLRNPAELQKAAEWFQKYRDHFPFHDRRTMALKLLDKAAEFGVVFGDEIDEMLEKQAGRGTYVPEELAQIIRNRVRATSPPQEFRERLEKMASEIQGNPHLTKCPDTVQNICQTLDTFDRMMKLAGSYSELIPRPEDAVFSLTYKVARAAMEERCVTITGSVYDRNDFSKLGLHDVRSAFGNDVADEVADGIRVDPVKMAEVAATLPRNDAQLLDTLMAEHGAAPITKHASALPGFDFKELSELSQLHQRRRRQPV